jgi:hypothetical protein
MTVSTAVGGDIGDGPWAVFGWGVIAVMFILGLDMPKPGGILSDQALIFANLFMLTAGEVEVEEGRKGEVVVAGSRVPSGLWAVQLGGKVSTLSGASFVLS